MSGNDTYVLLNKSDLSHEGTVIDTFSISESLNVEKTWVVSLKTGDGIQAFMNDFGQALQQRCMILNSASSFHISYLLSSVGIFSKTKGKMRVNR